MTGPVEPLFDAFRDHLVAFSPTAATRLGDHSRDADLDDWAPGAADERVRALEGLRGRLLALRGPRGEGLDGEGLDGERLDGEDEGDRVLLLGTVDSLRFELEGLRAPSSDPLYYLDLATGAVDDLVRRDDLPAGPRQAAVASRAAQIPRLLAQARRNLEAVPAPHREVALLRLPGAVQLLREVLPAFAPAAERASREAAEALGAFGGWLEELGDRPAPDWRLGPERWGDALRLALGVGLSPEEVWKRGHAALDRLQEDAEALAARVLAQAGDQGRAGDQGQGSGHGAATGADLVREGLALVAGDRSDRDELVRDAAAVLEEIKSFLRATDLFDLPEPDALRVEEVPPFQQGVAVAFFIPAPPLETAAPHTYYLSPVPGDWDAERTGSFLREYNTHALRSVGIHEAYPGHYVQFAHAQRHPRLLRRALWNDAFVEGWAVYSERTVIGAGFGDDRLALTNVKMEMRTVANALLDQGLHVHGWSDDEAMHLMTERAYQERSEAVGKLIRGKVTAGQLSTYFIGGEEMADLRRGVEAARGAAFSALEFHRAVLAQGSPPFSVLRRALLS